MILAILNLYVAPMPPIQVSAEADLRFGRISRWPPWRSGMNLAILISMSLRCLSLSFCSIRLTEEMSFEEFQDNRRYCFYNNII